MSVKPGFSDSMKSQAARSANAFAAATSTNGSVRARRLRWTADCRRGILAVTVTVSQSRTENNDQPRESADSSRLTVMSFQSDSSSVYSGPLGRMKFINAAILNSRIISTTQERQEWRLTMK